MTKFEASLQLKEGSPDQSQSFPLKRIFEKELNRLEVEGVLEKVTQSDWSAPVVPTYVQG